MTKNKIPFKITISEVADMLAVSSATVLNWVKTGILVRSLDDKKFFNTNDILEVKRKIESGEIERLSSRANKKISKDQFIPFESIKNKNDLSKIVKIIEEVKRFDLNIEETLFVLAINLLMNQKIISKNVIKNSFYFNNDNFRDEIRNWLSVLNPDSVFKELVYDIDFGEFSEDILGVFYQYFLFEGEKNRKGSYFTPAKIVNELVKKSLDRINFSSTETDNDIKILDPCCGTGKFLLGVSDYLKNKRENNQDLEFDPKMIWGFDNDKIAVRIARINLMLKFKDVNSFSPNIFHLDYLIDKFNFTRRIRFDAIITNPPWGAKFNGEDKILVTSKFLGLKTRESFSLFLIKSIKMLKVNGILSFLLPESLLNIKTHSEVRNYILENSNILSITKYGKLFKGVFTDVINLELKKNEIESLNKSKNNRFDFYDVKMKEKKQSQIDQNRFVNNENYIFDTDMTDDDELILSKIYKTRHKSLRGNSKWALGIVTGNNSKYVSDNINSNKNLIRIITGKEMNKYIIFDDKPNFIDIGNVRNFQQIASMDIYRAKEKLLYKFISNRLVFTYDNKQLFTLNSANVLIPKIPKISLKVVLALLNSSLYQYLFRKKFNSFKVLKGDLEKLPFPSWNKKKQNQIKKLVNILIQKNIFEVYRKEIYDELDSLIFKYFKLTKKEIEIVTNY